MSEQNKELVPRVNARLTAPAGSRLLGGLPAVLGGLIWSWTVIITALRPAGVPGAHRSTLDLHPTILVAFVLLGIAATAYTRPPFGGRSGWAGVALVWLGTLIFSVNVAFVLTTGDDAPVWPTHYLGFFVVGLGSAMLGVVIVRSSVMPAAVAMLMIAAFLLLPLSNMQDSRVWLWLPLGVAWLTVGGAWLTVGVHHPRAR